MELVLEAQDSGMTLAMTLAMTTDTTDTMGARARSPPAPDPQDPQASVGSMPLGTSTSEAGTLPITEARNLPPS